MFFLSALANIFVYLLVSGFFAACLFVKDETVTFETLQDVRIIHAMTEEHAITYPYAVNSQSWKSEPEKDTDELLMLLTPVLYSPPRFYNMPCLDEGCLRAPPVC